MDVKPGELCVYCPACPVVGVNLPENWKSNQTDWFVYRRMFVADGNFKADHVRNDRSTGDIWLSEGGLMDPRVDEYNEFLNKANEILTVRDSRQTYEIINL